MFDWNYFIKAVAWVIAIGGSILTLLQVALSSYYTFSHRGRLEVLMMRLEGTQPVFRWKTVLWTIVAWIAVFSFR